MTWNLHVIIGVIILLAGVAFTLASVLQLIFEWMRLRRLRWIRKSTGPSNSEKGDG